MKVGRRVGLDEFAGRIVDLRTNPLHEWRAPPDGRTQSARAEKIVDDSMARRIATCRHEVLPRIQGAHVVASAGVVDVQCPPGECLIEKPRPSAERTGRFRANPSFEVCGGNLLEGRDQYRKVEGFVA